MPCSGTFTGLTLANKSNSFLIATLALSIFGHGSPALGVVVGPFNMTSHCFNSATTLSGIGFIASTLFSIVKSFIILKTTLPLATASFNKNSIILFACAVIAGPIPSPPAIPITICCFD